MVSLGCTYVLPGTGELELATRQIRFLHVLSTSYKASWDLLTPCTFQLFCRYKLSERRRHDCGVSPPSSHILCLALSFFHRVLLATWLCTVRLGEPIILCVSETGSSSSTRSYRGHMGEKPEWEIRWQDEERLEHSVRKDVVRRHGVMGHSGLSLVQFRRSNNVQDKPVGNSFTTLIRGECCILQNGISV